MRPRLLRQEIEYGQIEYGAIQFSECQELHLKLSQVHALRNVSRNTAFFCLLVFSPSSHVVSTPLKLAVAVTAVLCTEVFVTELQSYAASTSSAVSISAAVIFCSERIFHSEHIFRQRSHLPQNTSSVSTSSTEYVFRRARLKQRARLPQ